jgi:hypothetical protein
MGRLGLAFRCFFRVLSGSPLPEEALALSPAAKPMLPAPPPAVGANQVAAIQLLALLQKEGRLLDFLKEDIDGYEDAQVGAAVRAIQRDCRRVLEEHIGVEPVLRGAEDAPVTVEKGFDPSRIRLIGNVTGEPPFSGTLKHHGWRATATQLPPWPASHDPSIIAPAEVELS